MACRHHPYAIKVEITKLLGQGFSPPALAKEYCIPESTLKHFPKEVLRKEKQEKDFQEAINRVKYTTIESAKASVSASSNWQVKLPTPASKEAGVSSVVLVIPDLHCPWEHTDALEFLKAVRTAYQPNIIVNLGDEVDFYGMSRFDHDPDVISPGNELSLAVKHLIPFYREFPDVLICQSNHTHRAHAKAQKAGLPASTMKSIEEILKTPEGWVYKHCHTVDGVDYKHGTGKSGANAHINHTKATGRSTCIGHIHAHAAVSYLRYGLFAANFGCLIDKKAPCFSYASEMDDNIVMGCGIVIGGKVAKFIPMLLDDNGRWVGEL